MKAFRPKDKKRPEDLIRDRIKMMLESKGWFVKTTHGSMYQTGFPDLFACHVRYGQRWVEVKRPKMMGGKFTPAQLRDFPKFCASGSGVWILTAATEEEYVKLFRDCNWWHYQLFKGAL